MGFQIFKEETGNRIIFVDNIVYRIFGSLFFIAFGAIIFLSQIFSYYPDVGWLYIPSLFLRLVFILFGGALLFFGLRALLVNESSIIDKKFQSVTIKRNSFIEGLRSIKEIPFSDILSIEIVRTKRKSEYTTIDETWEVYLRTIKMEYICIYKADNKSNAERSAEQIRKVTDIGICYCSQEI